VRVPGWVAAGIQDPYELEVRYQPEALETLHRFVKEGKLKFYTRKEGHIVEKAIRQILSLDIRSFHQGRGKRGVAIGPADMLEKKRDDDVDGDRQIQGYELDYDTLNVAFTVEMNEAGGAAWVSVNKIIIR
jgi:hypothetical protein